MLSICLLRGRKGKGDSLTRKASSSDHEEVFDALLSDARSAEGLLASNDSSTSYGTPISFAIVESSFLSVKVSFGNKMSYA